MSKPPSRTLSKSSPVFYGVCLGLLAAVPLIGLGAQSLYAGKPLMLGLALIVAGMFELLLCSYTFVRSRMAWAYAAALNGTLTTVFLLAAPLVRDGLGVGMAVGFVPFAGFATITALLASNGDQFS